MTKESLSQERLLEFKGQLEARLQSLLRRKGGQTSNEWAPELGDPAPADDLDRAAELSNRAMNLALQGREEELIGRLRVALKRIEEGSFGLCVDCGDSIAWKRLVAHPTTVFCLECQVLRETRRRGESARSGI